MQALWMVLASFLFATMGVGVKIASESFTTTELVFYRGIVSMIFMGVVMRANGISVRTPVVAMQAWRLIFMIFRMALSLIPCLCLPSHSRH